MPSLLHKFPPISLFRHAGAVTLTPLSGIPLSGTPLSVTPGRRYQAWPVSAFLVLAAALASFGAMGPVGSRGLSAQQPSVRPAGLSDGMRLATPQVAAQLELTEEQRTEISTLVTERAEALAEAGQDVDRRRQVQMEFEQKLVGVLTAAQRAQWDEMAAEPRLSFQFRLQKWSEVLDWFAEQSGLSLVMDAPPAGSFNYTDDRQYTPTEALDLLNSVLLSKGYTLIRRDKMLIVLDLTEGIPEGLVPRIPPGELEKRGRFEFVSVLIPLEGRPPTDVVAEVTPLLGPHGTAVALQKTGQILITDTAGVVRAVSSIIESIPKPSKPAQPPPAPSPELVVYPLDGLQAEAVLEVLEKLVSGAQIVVDRQADQLNVYALPKQHTAVESILGRMKAGDPVDRLPKLEVYRVPGNQMTQLLENIEAIAPDLRVTADQQANRLIAWGAPRDHDKIRPIIEQLGSREVGEDAPSLQAYDLPPNRTMATSVLSRLVPNARIVSPDDSERLLILATAKDHEAVEETLLRLESLSQPEERRRLKIYPVSGAQRTRFLSVLETLSSEMADLKVITDAEPGELSIWARPAQHAIVEQLLGELDVDSPDAPRFELRVYALEHVDVTTAQTTLDTLLPGTRLIPESARRRLLAWTTPDIHEQIAQSLEEIDVAPPGRAETLEVHRVPRSDLSTLVTAIQPLAPEARLATDFGTSSLLVWGTADEQNRVRQAVEQVVQAARGAQRQVRRVDLQEVRPDTAVTVVQSLVRRAVVTPSPDGKGVVIWAEPEDLAIAEEALRELDSRPAAAPRKLVAYPMQKSKLEAFMRMVDAEMVANLQLTADTTHSSLLARGTTEEHRELKELLEQFTEQLPDAEVQTAEVYVLENADPRAAYRALATVVPNARLSIDDVGSQLLATANKEDHALIRSLVEQMDKETQSSARAVLRSHSVRSGNPESVHMALSELFRRERDVNISLDQSTGTLLAFASSQQHEAIEKFLRELEEAGPSTNEARARFYPLGEADGTEIVTMLTSLFPTQGRRVQVTHDRGGNQLVVVAPAEQQAIIQEVLDQLPQETREVEVIALQNIDVSSASQAITRLFSHLNYSQSPTVDTDVGSQQLFVRGTQAQLRQIRDLLGKMGEEPTRPGSVGDQPANGLRVVPFRGDTREAIEQLRRIWPRLRDNDLRVLQPETGSVDREPSDWQLVSAEVTSQEDDLPAKVAASPGEAALPNEGASSDEAASPGNTAPPTQTIPPAEVSPLKEVEPAIEVDSPSTPATGDNSLPEATEQPEGPSPSLGPPVILVPGTGSITIASDDEEAAKQAEAILRALAGEESQPESRARRVGSQLMVYPLRHTDAESASQSIEGLVRGMGRGRGFLSSSGPFSGSVVAVPDTRLNAVVVYANRADQPLVESLLEVLDTPETPETLISLRPKLIPLKFAKVERVESVIRSVYRTQMQSGAGRRPINIPTGISSDLAAALQQANAAMSGPLLTLSSDPVSNTLIVMAPKNLQEEIEQLVAELDDADRNDPARSLQVLELEKVNSERIRDALDILLDGGNRNRTTRSRRR
jgi:type II secretory pathway component GspD/PulD (secretin)